MSTMVVQERHLWLNLAEMKDVDKARFLEASISQAGLFGDTVEGFAQQFSAVQLQTEAIQHILPRRDAPTTAAPGTRPQSARRRVAPGRDAADLSSLPLAVVETITQPRALSTRQTYALKWSLFHHGAVDGWSLGKYDLIVRFLKGARRMNPSRSPLTPSWDLSIVLA